jgi:hypothetical protein
MTRQRQRPQEQELPLIKIPFEKLPSKGLPYPENAVIEYRTYTFGETKMESASSGSAVRAVKRALNCITTTGMERGKLTILDLFYLGVLIKMSSEGASEFTMPYICWKCGHEDVHKFSQGDLDFKDIDESVESLPLKVIMNDGQELHFSPMTAQQYIDLYSGKLNAVFPKNKPDGVAPVATLIKNLPYKKAYDYLNGITDAEDRELVNDIDKMLMHEIKPLTLKCSNTLENDSVCNAELSLKLEGKEALLKPFRGRESSNKSRIFYGNAPKHNTTNTIEDGVSTGGGTE